MQKHERFGRFISLPENRAAFLAVKDLVHSPGLTADSPPLFLHGPPGSGKTLLVSSLARQVGRGAVMVNAGLFFEETASPDEALDPIRNADMVIVEDVEQLPSRAVEALIQIIDQRRALQKPTLFTSRSGPQRLRRLGEHFSSRLTSRLASGLVLALDPLGPASRLALLQEMAQRRQLALDQRILEWLAGRLNGSGRQLEGALNRLDRLARLNPGPLTVDITARHFQDQVDAAFPTVERIAQRVGGFFRVEPRQLQSRRRYRNVLLPRQVGMYLTRKLTGMSLGQIGAYFGGRDHTTVLHACRKVEQAMKHDTHLSGAVRQIHADLI